MSKALEAAVAALRQRYSYIDIGMHDDQEWAEVAQVAVDAALDALFPGDAVRAVYPWRTNADMIYDVWRLGLVTGRVYDATPGLDGLWWRRLVNNIEGHLASGIDSITLNGVGGQARVDFTGTHYEDNTFDTVAFDPPYKLNGNPDGLPDLSRRYGVDIPASINERHALMIRGLAECIRISRLYILVKCQDQVANNRMYWQTTMMRNFAAGGILLDENADNGWRKVPTAKQIDRFDMLGHYIPQPMKPSRRYPNGRQQRHAHARPSTLLVFEKVANQGD